jgi:hypothetical protein
MGMLYVIKIRHCELLNNATKEKGTVAVPSTSSETKNKTEI